MAAARALLSLPLLPSAATWLLVYCVVACVTTWRDNKESNMFRQIVQQGNAGDGNINRCVMRTQPRHSLGCSRQYSTACRLDKIAPDQLGQPACCCTPCLCCVLRSTLRNRLF